MNSETVVYCVVALILGMLLAHMLKSVCGCNKVVEGAAEGYETSDECEQNCSGTNDIKCYQKEGAVNTFTDIAGTKFWGNKWYCIGKEWCRKSIPLAQNFDGNWIRGLKGAADARKEIGC